MKNTSRRAASSELLESRVLLSTYYVSPSGNDTALGTSDAAAWKTLQKAGNTAAAGDTVLICAGTYAVGMNLFGKAGGTAAAPIRFLADPGVLVTHCATAGTNASTAGINVESTGGYYVIQGFHIVSDGSMQKAGIRVAVSSNVQILGNTVENAFTGIFTSNGDNLLIQGNTCNNSTDQHGIYMSLNEHNCVVRGNTLFGNNWDGLHMNALNGSPNDAALVENNVIYGNNLSGMDIEGVSHATFRNNVIYSNGKHGITIHSQDQANTPTTANNTFVGNTITSNSLFSIQVRPEDTQGEVIFNNVLVGGSGNYGSIGVSGTPAGLTSDYNVVMDSFSTNLGVSKLTLAQWRSQTGQDQHSVIATATQLFVNPAANNYHLKLGSPAIDAGIGVLASRTAPTADFDGNARPQGAGYDAGAYEAAGTSDTTAPIISNVGTSGQTATGVTITWNTDEAGDTQVEYGTSVSYGSSSTLDSNKVLSHSVSLTGLAASTPYHYRVKSRDAAGNLATSGDLTFTTTAPPDTTPPTILGWASAGTHLRNVGEAQLPIPDDGTFVEPRSSGVSTLVVSFSESVDPASITPAGVGVWGRDVNGQAVSLSGITISTSLRDSGRAVAVSFSQKLPDYARYLVRLTNVRDMAGNPLSGDSDRVLTALLGDVTGDRRVNNTDVGAAQSYRGIDPIVPSDPNQVRSDVTNDGRVNNTDVGGVQSVRGADARFIADPTPPSSLTVTNAAKGGTLRTSSLPSTQLMMSPQRSWTLHTAVTTEIMLLSETYSA